MERTYVTEGAKVKMELNRIRLAAVVMLGFALGAGAQMSPPPDGGPGGPRVRIQTGGIITGGPGEGVFVYEGMVGRFGGKTVTGKPYSAKVTITRSQALADGTRIYNSTTGIHARDASGDTYRDMKLPAIGPLAASGTPPEFIFIHKVSSNKDYMLNVKKKTYRELPSRRLRSGPTDREPGVEIYRRFRRGPARENRPAPQTVKYDSLSNVEYTKTTRTIPKGRIGNSADIVISTERWYSPDLQLLVKETRTDPRFGTTTYALSGISLKPDPSLFSVPAGYTLVQSTGRRWRNRQGRRGNGPPPPPPQN